MNEEVQAEVIEENGLTVTFSPASISSNFKALDAHVEGILATYADVDIDINDTEQVKHAKRERAYLNSLAKELDDKRKAIKREYEKPYKAFEDQVKAITAKIKNTSAKLDLKVKEAEQMAKDAREDALREHYEEFAPLLVPVVPFEEILEPKWLNKSFGEVKAQEELEAKVTKVATDWESLKKLDLEFYDVSEAEFFRTLDIAQAINYNNKLVKDRDAINDLKAEMEAPEEETQHIEPAPEPAPQPAPQHAEVATPWVIIIDSMTRSQAMEVGKTLHDHGVTGVFKQGILADVYMREIQNV